MKAQMTTAKSYEHDAKRHGCGILVLYGFGRRKLWPRRSSSTGSKDTRGQMGISISRRRRGGSDETSFLGSDDPPSLIVTSKPKNELVIQDMTLPQKPIKAMVTTRNPVVSENALGRKSLDGSSCGSSGSYNLAAARPNNSRLKGGFATETNGGESPVPDYYHNRQNSSTLVRASSSNMMVFSYLGNIRQAQPQNFQAIEYKKPKPQQQRPSKYSHGSVVRGGGVPPLEFKGKGGGDPEELKNMGNEEYRKGRFAESLVLYERAIMLDPDRASYRSNKGAALTGLGRLLEAVDECREAVRLEPSYARAHHRLATLYLRLGDAEKAMAHYKQSGSEANAGELGQAQAFQTHLSKCTEARKLKDWHTLLKEASSAIATGADAAPQVFASQAEALLRLHKVQKAEAAMSGAPEFEVDACTKFFGAATNAYVLLVKAQVDMAAGRFDNAVSAAQRAGRLDPSNMEIGAVVRKARAVSSARSNGNDLFKASRFSEACLAYGDGLQNDPLNTILLCNRAACRSKMGQWERAIEDCTAALSIRPSYTKARLRRADCNAKLERWEASIQDYEILNVECPGDTEVEQALLEIKKQLKKSRGEDVKENISNVVLITNGDRLRQYVRGPGMSVGLFCTNSNETCQQLLPFIEQLCKKYPSVNFLKVDTEENPNISKSEGVSSVPAFKIYKNGSQVKDIAGSNPQLLESSIKYHSS
ncbi:hypothetical protein AMTRI_Chr06g198740 [Amborella trichopoda]|uniref:Thioredoxin domain-containing protein n=1 Tax=Amborella trichopoda TaxID=13333 RepID=U5CMU2_AMBTC|nr:inactive TPR repeat-containing thioredoxin TTL3 [Amborella trichopoda]ERN14466.1 hypothetical protein AMTR_s00174p00014780 [Amborella trichopoda]|eukprot:XP_006852999.1 inactive TPR repeat-containing thioredoxin TTL3 [Amborella trichopoda]